MASSSEPQIAQDWQTVAGWVRDPGSYRVQLQLSLSPEMSRIIERLREKYDMASIADVLNLAVGVLNRLSQAADEGKRVGIAEPDQELETEITGL